MDEEYDNNEDRRVFKFPTILSVVIAGIIISIALYFVLLYNGILYKS